MIAFTGAQNSGKTTLMEELHRVLDEIGHPTHGGYNLPGEYDSVSRRSKDLGFGINEGSSFESQYHITLSYLLVDLETRKYVETFNKECIDKHREELQIEYIIYDRTIFDSIPYSREVCSDGELRVLIDLVNQHNSRYPISEIVYCDPVPFREDGHRSVNKEFQEKIITNFGKLVSPWYTQTLPLCSIEERVEKMLKVMDID